MIHVGHLLDESAGWSHRVGVTQLLNRVDANVYTQNIIALDQRALCSWPHDDHDIQFAPMRCEPALLMGITSRMHLDPLLQQHRTDVVHAWGISAAQRARTLGRYPLVLTCCDPRLSDSDYRSLRSLVDDRWATPVALACTSQLIYRNLVSRGIPEQRCAVIRPSVDFAQINQMKRAAWRSQLGVDDTDLLVTYPDCTRITDGMFDGVWSTHINAEYDPSIRIMISGAGQPHDRMSQLNQTGIRQNTFVRFNDALMDQSDATSPSVPFDQLICMADVMIVTSHDDFPLECIAWAMASSTVIIGTAGYALAELIAHKHNGLLFKRTKNESIHVAVAQLLSDREKYGHYAEVARGQAYEVFGLARYAKQYMRLYDNLMSGRDANDGISDSAMVA